MCILHLTNMKKTDCSYLVQLVKNTFCCNNTLTIVNTYFIVTISSPMGRPLENEKEVVGTHSHYHIQNTVLEHCVFLHDVIPALQ